MIAALYQHSFFYHYSAILIHIFLKYRPLTSISDQETQEGQNSALACPQSCIHQQSQKSLLYGHEAVFHHGHWSGSGGGGSNLIINKEEINLT